MKIKLRTLNYRFPDLDIWLDGTATFDEQDNMTVRNATGNVLMANASPGFVKWLTGPHFDGRGQAFDMAYFPPDEPEQTLEEMYQNLFG